MTNLDTLYVKALAAAEENDPGDRTAHGVVVEYGVREMMKGKSPKAAANATTKKLHGTENLFLGPGVSHIDAKKLEKLLWTRLAEFAIKGIASMKPGFEHYSIEGTLQHFGQKPASRAELKKTIIGILGKNPFTHDDK